MVKDITREMLWEAGVQFGHQTKRWNPKMKPYIYGKKNNIHIIDLQQTIYRLGNLKTLTDSMVEKKGKILFIGTKKSAKGAVEEAALRTDNFYVNQRWLGGTLTNLKTIHSSIKTLWDIERKEKSGYYDKLGKKELAVIIKQKEKLENSLGGIKHMRSLPAAIFVVDPKHENIAVREARKLNIPIIGICDTNSDPDLVDYIIPGNDDTYRAVSFLTNHIAEIYAESFGMEIPPAKPIEKRKPRFIRPPRFENSQKTEKFIKPIHKLNNENITIKINKDGTKMVKREDPIIKQIIKKPSTNVNKETTKPENKETTKPENK